MTTRRAPLANRRRAITVALCALLATATTTVTACGRGAPASEPEPAPTSDPQPATAAAQLTPVIQAVPTPPRWYRGTDGGVHLSYELLLTNTLPIPVDVVSVQVRADDQPIDTLAGDRLVAAMSPLGSETGSSTTLPAATVGVVWVDLTVSSAEDVPEWVSQEVTVDVGPGLPVGPRLTSVGGRAAVTRDEPVIIQAPLAARRWVALAGVEGPHRRALQAVDGQLWLSQRFAVDFSAQLDGEARTHAGDPAESASYFNYGEEVLAVGSGTVVEAVDRLPDQIPNDAVPLPIAQADGNHVILKLAEGVYAGYAHLEPGSVRVQAGDHVEAGQIVGRLGNSGASTGPHLHFQLMNRPSIVAADGLPFAYDDVTFDGAVTSLEGFLQADLDGTPVPIDPSGAGSRHDEGGTGIDVLTFPADDRSDAERRPPVDGDFSGALDIGDGRQVYVECRGKGSPTVVLIAGQGNNAGDWHQVLDPADPVRDDPFDQVGAGQGDLHDSPAAVFPQVAPTTRVCAFDRPDTRTTGGDLSTPRTQPHTVDLDVDDLHRLLTELDVPKPYVLVAHSYGGFVAELYARTYPADVGGLVMVDAVSSDIEQAATASKLARWDELHRSTAPGTEGVEVLDALARLDAVPALRRLPAVVLSADKPYRTDLLPPEDVEASVTFTDWRDQQERLAARLGAEHVTTTNSGHHVYLYSPQLVIDAIREVVRRT